jgi:hypothetical protein
MLPSTSGFEQDEVIGYDEVGKCNQVIAIVTGTKANMPR